MKPTDGQGTELFKVELDEVNQEANLTSLVVMSADFYDQAAALAATPERTKKTGRPCNGPAGGSNYEDGRDLKSVGKTRIESEPHRVLITIRSEVVCVRRDIQGVRTVYLGHIRSIPVQ